MNWNYCPNCGQKLQYEVLTCMPPIEVISCHRCGWEMRQGRAPTWSNPDVSGTAVPQPQRQYVYTLNDFSDQSPKEEKDGPSE